MLGMDRWMDGCMYSYFEYLAVRPRDRGGPSIDVDVGLLQRSTSRDLIELSAFCNLAWIITVTSFLRLLHRRAPIGSDIKCVFDR